MVHTDRIDVVALSLLRLFLCCAHFANSVWCSGSVQIDLYICSVDIMFGATENEYLVIKNTDVISY